MRAIARAQTYVNSHNVGSHIKVSLIWYMYTCEYMHVYRENLSVSTRKGTDICQLAQHGVIYKSICNMKYVYLGAYVCIQKGSKCEHSQGHNHLWVRRTSVHIHKYLWHDMVFLVNVCTYRNRASNLSTCQGRVRRTWVHTQRDLWYDICMFLSICVYTKRF